MKSLIMNSEMETPAQTDFGNYIILYLHADTLNILDLSENKLQGRIPPQFEEFIVRNSSVKLMGNAEM